MRQLPAGFAMLLLLIGCGRSAPRLQYSRIGLAESHDPVILAVELENLGETTAAIDGCDAEVLSVHIFTARDSKGDWPEKFEYHLELSAPPDSLTIPSGKQSVIPVAFVWDLADSAPDLIAICCVKLRVGYDASFRLGTEEVMVVLASSPAAREKILGKPLENVADPATVLKQLESFEGKKSKDAMRLIERLRELVEP